MKVLMIDDEPLARIGIRSIIPWEENGFTLVGEAKNGVEGLEMAEKYHPDIILVDIIMPEMDGIEFIRRVKPKLPDCKIIIMSCMNEIQYYQEAIHLNVSEYILKDKINPDEILEVVNRVANELRKARIFDENDVEKRTINKNVVLTEFMNLVLSGQIRDGIKIAGKLEQHDVVIAGKKFSVACISAYYDNLQEEDDEGGFFDFSVINLCQEVILAGYGGYVFKSYDGKIAALLPVQGNTDGEIYMERLFSQLKETAEQCMDCLITMGVSKAFNNPECIYEGYLQACSALEISFTKGRGHLYSYLRDQHFDRSVYIRIEKILHEILKMQSIKNLTQISVGLNEITKLMPESGLTLIKARSIYVDIFYHILSLIRREDLDPGEILNENTDVYSFFDKLNTVTEFYSRLVDLINKTTDFWNKYSDPKCNHIIMDIHRYIEDHLQEKITLDNIAGKVFLSSSYLCRLYKKETGENLQDYILKRKIERAKTLLPLHNVGTVADLLGFNSHSYFIRVFKEQTGQTPLQYQKK
jgi:Response regulator containing CheY-like receiver domain and AraC-type DNA-binding domain